jgi:FKBP-type peptidyl-prolyl cis-trans isomerase
MQNKKTHLVFVLALFTALPGCNKKPEGDLERSSYFIGQQIGQNLKKQNLNLKQTELLQGITDALEGKNARLSETEMQAAQNNFNKLVNSKIKETEDKNKKSAEQFLEENKKNAGWATTASGLQYKVLKEGSGKSPGEKSTVQVHYTGTLLDGTKFDSSRDRTQPGLFKVDGVIPGWTEALKLMKPGAHFVVVLPPQLAYGPTGAGPIPPNSVLVFDMELLAVNDGDQPAKQDKKKK